MVARATVTAVRKAPADVEAVEVDLDGQTGHLLPDHLEAPEPLAPRAALLPSLDPTTMAGPSATGTWDPPGGAVRRQWERRPTVWWDGRIVGGWHQDDNGDVELQLPEDVGADGLRATELEAARLTEWLGGVRALPRCPAPLSKAAATNR